jgi:hypothetical protein
MLRSCSYILLVISQLLYNSYAWTCQGSTYTSALAACPDQGSQMMSMGGNLTINVLFASSVPNKDVSLPSSKLDNPYIRFTVGGRVSRRTNAVPSSSGPVWNENVNIGFLGSGTLMTVELWNAFSGVLFTSKLIASTTFNVPFCSYFKSNTSAVDCGHPFGCSAYDSSWAMPTRRVCQENGIINFTPKRSCSEGGICLYLTTTMIPFQMGLELSYPTSMATTPVLTVAGRQSAQAKWSMDKFYGLPFLSSSASIDVNQVGFRTLRGALMWRISNSEKSYGSVGSVKFYSSVNFPSTIYICRYQGDNSLGVPTWISREYNALFKTAKQVTLSGSGEVFDCYYKSVQGTTKNKWGGVESNAIALRSNKIPGAEADVNYKFMYIVLAVPVVEVEREATLTVAYDAVQFLSLFGSYGLICCWFIFLVFNFIRKRDYRVDRLSSYLVTRVLTGKDRNLLAALFLNKNLTPNNIDYRAHLFHAMFAMFLCFTVPFFLLIGWGMSCAMIVRPRGIGIAITFVGFACLLGCYGFSYWEKANWRLSALSLTSISFSILFFMIFLLVSLFVDPTVLQLDASIDFVGLSLIFGALNCVPCLLLIFKNDRCHQVYMTLVVGKISEAVHLLKQKLPPLTQKGEKNDSKINRILHALLGETYSINPKVPSFKYSSVIHEPVESYHNSLASSAPVDSSPSSKERDSESVSTDEGTELLTEERKLYGVAMLILFIYLMFAIGGTKSPSLAFLNIWALVLLDGIHLSISKSDTDWTPGFKVLLLVLGRILICGSPQSLWLLNYSACYALYSITLIYEMVNTYLPKLSTRKAGEIVFGGGDYQQTVRESLKTNDISGSPSFCLGLLSLCFLSILVISAFLPSSGTNSAALDVPSLTVLGSTNWPIYIFGLIAFLVTGISGLAMATLRAFELEHHGLLRGWARETYLFRKQIKLPFVLAVCTETAILLSGLLLYAITKVNAILVGCIFLPAIFFCLGLCLRVWVKNDYDLIKWPRPKGEDNTSFWAIASASAMDSMSNLSQSMKNTLKKGGPGKEGAEGGDLETAFNIMENLVQNDNKAGGFSTSLVEIDLEDENPETNTTYHDETSPLKEGGLSLLKGFSLPPLKGENKEGIAATKEIKMPPLPLKSVLRRKRQTLQVKAASNNNNDSSLPLIADLRGRDNAKEKDQFGNKKDDVIDLDDPWAQFESNEDERLLSTKKSRKESGGVNSSSVKYKRDKEALEKKRKIPLIRRIRLFLKKNKYFSQITTGFHKFLTHLPLLNGRIYPSKYQVTFEDDDSAKEKLNGTGDEDDNEDDDDDDDIERNRVIQLHGDDEEEGDDDNDDEDDEKKKNQKKKKEGNVNTSSKFVSMKDATDKRHLSQGTMATSGGSYNRLKNDADDDLEELDENEIAKLSFWDAFWKGYLNSNESFILYMWFTSLVLIMFFGISLSVVCSPLILGFIVWISLWLLLFFGIPIYKYFQIYSFDSTSRTMMNTGFFLHVLFSLTFLFDSLYSEHYDVIDSIWILDFLIYFPLFLYIIFNTMKWFDSGFKLAVIDDNEDGQISFREALKFLRTFPSIMVMLVLLNWQLYLWINLVVGLLFTLAMIISGIAYLLIKDWARNNYFLSPELRAFGYIVIYLTIFLSFMIAVFREENPVFPLSVGLFTLAFLYLLKIINRLSFLEKGSLFYFSPYIMPVFSYHPVNQDISDESDLAKNCLIVLLLGILWGATLAIFLIPIHIGIAIACSFILLMASIVALCSSYIPQELAKSNALLTAENIIEAANYAKERFVYRKEPLNLEIKDFSMDLPEEILENDFEKIANNKTLYQKLIERTTLENAIAIMADLRSLKYVKEDRTKTSEAKEAMEEEEEDEYELPWYNQLLKDLVLAGKDFMRNIYELLPINKQKGWKLHAQSPFTVKDIGNEIIFRGYGPFGFLGAEGMIYRYLKTFKGMGSFLERWFYPKWTEKYDSFGNDSRLTQMSDFIDYQGILTRVVECDKALDFTYKEETRCAIHFLLMLLISSDSKLQREQVLFQKFLRENRYRLASNGIIPPRDIFSSTSFASINIPLVAIWLSTLSKDEQDRFHLLKHSFNLEQRERDEAIDQADYEELMKASDVKKSRLVSHINYMNRISVEISQIRLNKITAFQDSLIGYERNKFLLRKDLWVNDPTCFVELKDMELYERFKKAVFSSSSGSGGGGSNEEDYNIYAQNFIHDCETAQKDIRSGEYGRNYQFVDSEFPPSESSLGDSDETSLVLGWRCAPGIIENIDLFEGGTHPDDMMEGIYQDSWLLSAISMIVAASYVGSGYINEQIRRIFIAHPSQTDGELTLTTEVGVYGIQLFRNSEWIPVLIDDVFPMRRKEQWTNENRGLAVAHLKECRGLWLPLIEKAFAKYYGSYSSLNNGYVHHALEDLTGCEAECLPLSAYSRGINKSSLWDRLLKYKRNGYILGGGTGSADFIDKELLEMGINFNSHYTIYDIFQIDNYRLIKLRNPPGDHDSWKGDWSASSALWTRRLRYKCNYQVNSEGNAILLPSSTNDGNGNGNGESNAKVLVPGYDQNDSHNVDHNTFFITFDDFLNVFRFLYVCKYYNPNKWHETRLNGFWKQSNDSMIEEMELMNQLYQDGGGGRGDDEDDMMGGGSLSGKSQKTGQQYAKNEELLSKKKIYAQLNSSGGLPTKHNPNCQLENNPHYSLNVYRPTDIKLSVTQYDGRYQRSSSQPGNKKSTNSIQSAEQMIIPFSVFIIKNGQGAIPRRLDKIVKDDIVYSSGESQYEKTINVYANNLLPGKYTVLIAPYLAGMEGKFRLSVLTNYRIDCSPLWPPAWMLRDGDIFSAQTDEKLEDQMKRNFVRGSDVAKKNMNKAKDLFQKGLRQLLGANNPFEKDDDDEGEEGSDDSGGNGGGGDEAVFPEV